MEPFTKRIFLNLLVDPYKRCQMEIETGCDFAEL
jgi:hypothetical protein